MTDRFSLQGRTALVTGASRGLGWAIAKALAEAGAEVVLNARYQETLDQRVRELEDAGYKGHALAFDAADFDACRQAVERTVAAHGRLDILVNNAGINIRQPLADYSDADWQRVVDVNLSACFVLAREAARSMVAQGWGRIISIGSVMSFVARPTIPSYVATKHGIAGLTKALAVELGPKGVTANAIAPGYFNTELNAPLIADKAFDAMVTSRTPVGRWAEPEEIGGAAVFLASNAASYVNGTVLTVDGGMTAAL